MSSNSWRQYGGRNITINDTINVGTVIANQFLTRTTSSITNTFQNVNILGELIVGYDSTIGKNLFVKNNQYNSNNLYLNNKLLFGTTALTVDPNYAYITGNQYNIGINTIIPSTIFHITGNNENILTVDTQTLKIRNILGQNVNKKGLVITAQDTETYINFYNDSTTDVSNNPNAFIRYNIGNNLTLNTQNNINLTSNNINLQFNAGSANFNQTNINIKTPGNIISGSQSSIVNYYARDNINPNSSIQLDTSGVILNTTDNIYVKSNNKIYLNTIITEISSNLVVSRNGIYNNIYNETTTIYDSSNSLYLSNIYDNSFSNTGNALTLVGVDNSSNTTARIVAPNNIGLSITGGISTNDSSRSFAAISLTDINKNNIISHTILSGKDPVKYYSTIGINTYSPKTEQYVFDINGPTRIGNGEINIVSIPNFEIIFMKFSKLNPMSGIAVGTPTTSFGLSSLTNSYNQYVLYTKNGGITWNLSNVGGFSLFSNIQSNTFTGLYVYDQNFSIIGTTQSNLFYTYDGGINWKPIFFTDSNVVSLYKNISTIIINGVYNNGNITSYSIFIVYNYINNVINTDSSILYNKNNSYFNLSTINISDIVNSFTNNINLYLSSNNNNILSTNTTINNGNLGINNYYFVGNTGIYKYNSGIITITSSGIYNDIYNIDDNNYVAVGNNIIFICTNGITSTLVLSNINLKSVYLYDLSLGVAVGDNGVFMFSNNWSISNSWNIVPTFLLNSSGISNRILGKNLIGIKMYDINTFIIATIIKPYNLLNNQLGKSQILLCYYPNLFNRSNNKVFDVSGNMFISGDININDGGQLLSNNTIFNVFYNSQTVKQINIGTNTASTAINGNLYAGGDVSFNQRLYVVNDTSLNTRLFVGGDVSLNSRLTVYADTSLNTRLFVGGDVSLNSRLTVYADTSLNTRLFVGGDVSLNSRLTVYADTSLNTRLFVGGDVSLNSRLTVYADTSLNTRLFVGGDVSLNSRLTVYADTSLNTRLFVGGDVSLNSRLTVYADTSLNTRLFVGGDVSLNSRLFVSGDVSFNSRLTVYSDVYFNTRLLVVGDVSLNSRLTVYNDTSLNTRLFVGGDVSLNSRLTVYADTSLNTRLFVGGDVSFNSRLFVNGDVSFNNRLFIDGDVSINQRLIVLGDVSLNGNVVISKDTLILGRLTVQQYTNKSIINTSTTNFTFFVGEDLSLSNRLFVGDDSSLNGNLYVNNSLIINKDTTLGSSINSRLFITGDISINNGNLIVLNNKGIFSTIFDNSNVDAYNPGSIDSSGIYFGIKSSSINIGSYGYGLSTKPSTGSKIITIGSGSFTGELSTSANSIYIGSGLDYIYINGKVRYNSKSITQYSSPLIQLNCVIPPDTNSANTNAIFVSKGNISTGTGISIAYNDNSYAGYIISSTDSNGYIFKAPYSTNVINLNIDSLSLLDAKLPPQQALSSSIITPIKNGILVLTDETLSSAANYKITVKPIDISNIFLRDINSTTTYQQVLTNVGISGDLSVMLNNRLFVYGDSSFNSRVFINSDVSMNNRLFISNDVSMNGSLFVSNISSLSGPIYQF